MSLRRALGEDITFVAADERLLRVAEAEGLQTLNVVKFHPGLIGLVTERAMSGSAPAVR